MSLIDVATNGCPNFMLTLDSFDMGYVVHERASCSSLTRIRSSDEQNCDGDGQGGRRKGDSVYKIFQSRLSYVLARTTWKPVGKGGPANGKETCCLPPDNILGVEDI